MLKNQIRVLIQRVHNAGRTPKKILLSKALRDALGMEAGEFISRQYRGGRSVETFGGVPIAVVTSNITEPMIELEDDGRTPKEVQIKDLL